MRKTLWDARAREELISRLNRLKPDTPAVWGSMNARQMVVHLVKWMQMIDGTLPIAPRNLPLRYPGIKQALIYVFPFPKGVPTAPELITEATPDWERECSTLRQYLESFEKLDRRNLPDHPAFGRLTPQAWGVLGYRHTNHHLRQFGV